MSTDSSTLIKKLLFLFLVIAGLHFAKEFLIPLFIGAVIATLFLPLCKWLEGIKVPRALAAFICLLLLLLVIAGAVTMLGWQISDLTNDITLIKRKAILAGNNIQEYIFNHFGISAEKQLQLLKDEQPSFSGIIQAMAGSLAFFITNFILTMVYIFCLLYYRNHIKNFFLKLFPPSQQEEMSQVVNSATHVTQQYIVGLSKMIFCLWIMYGISFSIIGVKNAILFAILCGLLEIVPFIGNITGTTITLLVAGVHGASLPMLAGILISYGIVQLIQGWILEPLILGPQVKINPFFTIIALVVGEIIWGIPGIILAIPITALLKIICDHVESLKPYGFLIGEINTGKPEPDYMKKIKNWFTKKKTKSI
jgi:predicted PurR-regulated permease PerM